MLAKKYRLPVQSAFGKKGKEYHFPDFLVKVFSGNSGNPRFGIVLRKGIVKKAVERNRIRRAFFNGIRKSDSFAGLPNLDMLFIAGKTAAQMKEAGLMAEIQSAMDAILSKSGIMK